MSNAKFIATMDEWMRDILRRVEKLERRRSRPATSAQIARLEDRLTELERRLPPEV